MRIRRQMRILQAVVAAQLVITSSLAWIVTHPSTTVATSSPTQAELDELRKVIYDHTLKTANDPLQIQRAQNIAEQALAQSGRAVDPEARQLARKAYDKALEPCLIYRQFC